MPADPSIYDSERLASYYSRTRPPVHEAICAKLFDALPAGFKARTALDIGCGAGMSTAVLVPRATRVTGVDPYLPMLAQARRRVPSATFLQATATSLPADTASIDLVTAAGSLNYTDVNLAIAEVARVLASGGYLAVYDFSTGRVSPQDELAESSFLSFERTFPWPAGYAMSLDRLPLKTHGLSLLRLEKFVVELSMTVEDYIEYLLGETNVEAAVSQGLNEGEARSSCHRIFGPVFERGPRQVGFASILLVATNRPPRRTQ